MAKAQGKKAGAGTKAAAKKAAARVKAAAGAAKKKLTPKKPAAKKAAAPVKPAAKKTPAKTAPAKKPPAKKAAATKAAKAPAKKTPPKPAAKAAQKVKAVVKAVKSATKKAAVKGAKPVPEAAKPKTVKAPKAVNAPKAAVPVPPVAAEKPVKPATPQPSAAAPQPAAEPAPEKKRGRRARPRVHSNGAPAAAWLSTEKPRPASFIPAPPRAEAPAAIAAPPASSDRLIRPEDIEGHPAVRTVPVRIDIEQGAGRFYVIANPMEVTVRVGEGLEWDFRYIGGSDVAVEEIAIEFHRPAPFAQHVFRTRKPGGARPHRQLSGAALASAAGTRAEYAVRAITPYKTDLASTKVWVNVVA